MTDDRRDLISQLYPSIVGSGPNATILHYQKSTRRMEPGDLLLVDAAANYQGLTGDITRTYPVTGTYSREQRDIDEIVFVAQQAGEQATTPANDACIEKARPLVQKYKNIGARIEDSYLLTASGLEHLSASVPRTLAEVERFLKQTTRRACSEPHSPTSAAAIETRAKARGDR